jgi:WD40 repeat protein
MSFTSHHGLEAASLQSGQQSALETINRQRAGGRSLDAVTIEAANEIYEEIDDEEFERGIAPSDSRQQQSAQLLPDAMASSPAMAASFDPFANRMPEFCVNASPDVRTFSHAKKVAADDFKKLIVNILDQSLTSVNQNRDLWSNHDVAALVIEHYCLFQVDVHSHAGRKYLKRHPLNTGAESFNLPIIDILDPSTGALIQRSSHVDARVLCRILRHHQNEDVSAGTPRQPSPLSAPSRAAHAAVASQSDVESLSDEGDSDMALAIALSFDDESFLFNHLDDETFLLSLGVEGKSGTAPAIAASRIPLDDGSVVASLIDKGGDGMAPAVVFNAVSLSSDVSFGTCVATLAGHSSPVRSVAFHSTLPLLATGSWDKTVKLWLLSSDNSSATCVATLEGHSGHIWSVAFHPTAPLLATGSRDETVKLWLLSSDNSSATCVATLTGHSKTVTSVSFHPTLPLLAAGSWDKTVKLWLLSCDNSSATCVATLEGHSFFVHSVAFHPTLPLLATGSYDNTVKLWLLSSDNSSATCVATLAEHSAHVYSVAFHPTLQLLATGSWDKTVKLWLLSSDNSSATCVATLEGHSSIYSVAFHPTLPLLAAGSVDKTVRVWLLSSDNSSATCVATLAGHGGWVSSVAFHPKAPLLATGSWDNTVRLWR